LNGASVRMASELFVFTASNKAAQRHRERTIEQLVRVDEIEPHAAPLARQLRADGHGQVRCWGSIPGSSNLRSWKRMQPGHWALLYAGEETFPWILRVARTGRSKRLARSLWGDDGKGQTWELMFFFDLAQQVDLGLSEVRAALAYEEGRDWVPQGLQYPAPWRQSALLEKFGSFVAIASATPVAAAEETPASPPPIEGSPYKGRPSKPPRSPRRRLPPDPDRSGRGFMAHEETVEKLRRHIGSSFRTGTREVNHDGTWRTGGSCCICEVKSVTAKNEVGQLQKGLGQVLHNRFKAQRGRTEKVKAFLVAEREPSNSALWVELAGESDVVFTWPERFQDDIEKP
jgi:hypothetical protein